MAPSGGPETKTSGRVSFSGNRLESGSEGVCGMRLFVTLLEGGPSEVSFSFFSSGLQNPEDFSRFQRDSFRGLGLIPGESINLMVRIGLNTVRLL